MAETAEQSSLRPVSLVLYRSPPGHGTPAKDQNDRFERSKVQSPAVTDSLVSDNTKDERSKLNEKEVYPLSTLQKFKMIWNMWIEEFLALLVALVALAAIVIILATHRGRPLPGRPFKISINALVSVFAVILKGTMMIPVASSIGQLKWSWFRKARPLNDLVRFDLASRGIWGSARLLERLRGLHLASLGATITILALASQPLIQQVIQTYPCPQNTNLEEASLPRTNAYSQSGIHTGVGLESLDLPMQAAIYEGMYNSFFPIQPTCTTGNCTFGRFRTAGMCSSCHNVTDQLDANVTGCQGTWQLPSGLNLTIAGGVAMRIGTTEATLPYAPYAFPATTEIVTFQRHWGGSGVVESGNCTLPFNPPIAVECSLYPCVRTYSCDVVQGQTSEELLSMHPMEDSRTSFNSTKDETASDVYSAMPMPCLIDGTYVDAAAFLEHNSSNLGPFYDFVDNNQSIYVPPECYFTFIRPLGLQEYLPGFLSGFAMDATEVDHVDPAWMGQLYKGGNATVATISDTWSNLADSMTAHIRLTPDYYGVPPARGSVWHNETCIGVYWHWLAYPAGLLVLTLVFLLATIVQSMSEGGQQAWKSSPLALLFHGLHPDLHEKMRHVNRPEDMEHTAKKIHVQLRHEDGESRFVEVFSGAAHHGRTASAVEAEDSSSMHSSTFVLPETLICQEVGHLTRVD